MIRRLLSDGSMPYTPVKYSHSEVRAAGNELRRADPNDAIRQVLDNWRAAHTRPLIALRMNLQHHVRRVAAHREAPVIAQRIKREESIVLKLRRLNWLHLDRMQDIGGVRAVVSTVTQVRKLRDQHIASRSRNRLVKQDDYLDDKPKSSGYRGIHLVYAFHCPRTSWHGLNVEVQLRTFLQHQWATANEVVGYGRGEKFKSGEGDTRWLRMFTLLGAAFAQVEKTKAITESSQTYGPVPGTLPELRPLIAQLNKELGFRTFVSGLGFGFKAVDESPEKKKGTKYWFLLRLDLEKKLLNIWSYRRNDTKSAEGRRTEIEQERDSGANIDVCLVSVKDMTNLRKAYPNYYLDTGQFLTKLDSLLTPAPDPSS